MTRTIKLLTRRVLEDRSTAARRRRGVRRENVRTRRRKRERCAATTAPQSWEAGGSLLGFYAAFQMANTI